MYHTATEHKIGEQLFNSLKVTAEKKYVKVRGCETCPAETYKRHKLASKALARDTYKLSHTDYIIAHSEGTYLWVKFPAGLGKKKWSKEDPYNVFTRESDYAQSVNDDPEIKRDLEKTLRHYSKIMHKEYKKFKTQDLLPRTGLITTMFF